MSTYIVYGISDCPACLRACADLMEADHAALMRECSERYAVWAALCATQRKPRKAKRLNMRGNENKS